MPVSLVTPSTTLDISSPKRSRTSSIDAEVSSTVSCSSAAHSVSVSRRMPAQIRATPTGCTMKSSPDLRRWAAWCSQANTNASWTAATVDLDGGVGRVLGDDREQVAEQPPLRLVEVQLRLRGAAAVGLDTGLLDGRGGLALSTLAGRAVLDLGPRRALRILCDRHVHRVGDHPPGLKRFLIGAFAPPASIHEQDELAVRLRRLQLRRVPRLEPRRGFLLGCRTRCRTCLAKDQARLAHAASTR